MPGNWSVGGGLGISLEDAAMEVVQCVFRLAGSAGVIDEPALLKSGRAHTLLNVLDEYDVFDLQHGVEIIDCRLFGLVRLRRLQEEVVCLERPIGTCRNDVENDHGAAAGIAHETGRGPKPPDSMGSHFGMRWVGCGF